MNRMRVLLLLAALVLVPAQGAWAGGFDGLDGGTPPFMPDEGESNDSDWLDLPRSDGEDECVDLELGPECDNDFPPGETAPPEEPGGGDKGPEDTGGDTGDGPGGDTGDGPGGDTGDGPGGDTGDGPGGDTGDGPGGDTAGLSGADDAGELRPIAFNRAEVSVHR